MNKLNKSFDQSINRSGQSVNNDYNNDNDICVLTTQGPRGEPGINGIDGRHGQPGLRGLQVSASHCISLKLALIQA